MKRYFIIISLMILFISSIIRGEEFSYEGEIQFNNSYYMMPDKWEIVKDNFSLLDIGFIKSYENDYETYLKFKMRFQLRFNIFNTNYSFKDLSNVDKLFNYELLPWEIWIELNDIFIKGMQIKVGKQYFEWGTADGIHPTSVLNPDDFSNPFNMGEKIPVMAYNINYTYKSLKLSFIVEPLFKPIKLPLYFNFYNDEEFAFNNLEILKKENTLKNPPSLSDGINKAFKIYFSLFNIDFSAGYFKGYDYIPEIYNIQYNLTGNMITQYNININWYFPKMDTYTFDFTTDIYGFGFWGEAAVYKFPSHTVKLIFPFFTSSINLFDGKPYISYVLGTDYNFENGSYFNFQYFYGLPFVRGKESREDYLVLTLRDSFFDDFIGIEFVNFIGFNHKYNLKENNEFLLTQKVTYTFTEDMDLSLMITEIDAKKGMLFYSWRKYDTFTLQFKYSF